MNFDIPTQTQQFLDRLDAFIAAEITPLQMRDDNERFFDHRRENSRTDWDNDGAPRQEWEQLMAQSVRLADKAGFYRFALPQRLGGQGGSNLDMAIIREHLAAKGLGLFNDLQTEHSVVGNLIGPLLIEA
jgi:acyl-CoA dehydrogenase